MRNALILIFVFVFLLATSSFAQFHDSGVAHCNACHTMHNSEDGQLVDSDSPNGNAWLLNDATPSDVCLNCHKYGPLHVMSFNHLSPVAERGAGDFIFLIEDNLNDGLGGASNPISGDAAGHNIISPGHGLTVDATLSTAPGGTFPSSQMSCTSCHDPHGNENFRMLNGIGAVQDGSYSFINAAPIASGFGLYWGGDESSGRGTVYTSGMSEWCGNCHVDMHSASSGGDLIHPSGVEMGATIASAYSVYNGSDDQTGGSPTTSFIPQVPFEGLTRTSTSDLVGPDATSKVTCITCHRAHASSAPNSGRWDFNVTMLEDDGVISGSFPQPNPYSDNQRSLCNKCHVKDAYDKMSN